MTKLLIGLGNPGTQYARTRHNVGFIFIDMLCQQHKLDLSTNNRFSASIAKPQDESLYLLVKPLTYMNLSGGPVLKLCSYYKIIPSDIVVVHDDLDLELGRIKLKLGGGSGGHNGLRSIDSAIGPNYYRLRCGIGRPKFGDSADYVLSNFRDEERDIINRSLAALANSLHLLYHGDTDGFHRSLSES